MDQTKSEVTYLAHGSVAGYVRLALLDFNNLVRVVVREITDGKA